VQIKFKISGTDLFTCRDRLGLFGDAGLSMDEGNAQELLLATDEWTLNGQANGASRESKLPALTMSRPRDPRTNAEILDECLVTIKIARGSASFLVKSIFSTVLVVLGSLVCAPWRPASLHRMASTSASTLTRRDRHARVPRSRLRAAIRCLTARGFMCWLAPQLCDAPSPCRVHR
jgi:hypothetical protein